MEHFFIPAIQTDRKNREKIFFVHYSLEKMQL